MRTRLILASFCVLVSGCSRNEFALKSDVGEKFEVAQKTILFQKVPLEKEHDIEHAEMQLTYARQNLDECIAEGRDQPWRSDKYCWLMGKVGSVEYHQKKLKAIRIMHDLESSSGGSIYGTLDYRMIYTNINGDKTVMERKRIFCADSSLDSARSVLIDFGLEIPSLKSINPVEVIEAKLCSKYAIFKY